MDLANCGLTQIPVEVLECIWLEELIVSNSLREHDLGGIGTVIRESKNIGPKNKLLTLNPDLHKLKNLKKLVISGDIDSNWKLNDISSISKLSNLEYLNISRTSISDVNLLKRLNKLKYLYLNRSLVKDLDFVKGLTNLEVLDVSETQVLDLSAIELLIKLVALYASETFIKDLKFLKNLRELRFLSVHSTKILSLEGIQNLDKLQVLYAFNNLIEDLSPLKEIVSLKKLYVNITKINNIIALQKLENLNVLNISHTKVEDLSPIAGLIKKGVRIHDDTSGKGVLIKNCPLVSPPVELISQGRNAIINYFNETYEQGVDTLYEAKLLIIGEGGAGKTSLYRRLCHPKLPLPPEKDTTRGIDIHHYEFDTPEGKKFRVNVWDFGGQEIYHSTHQFFLTKRSLYILLDDTRTNHKTAQDEGFKYWLEVVETLTDRCPILIFQNEKGGRSKAIDIAGIKGRFDNVKECYQGNLEFNYSVNSVRQAIQYWVKQLPHVGVSLPKKWILIRKELEYMAENQPYISQKEYFQVYSKHLTFEQDRALYLSQYLHDLGVFLHFQDDRILKKTIILQNAWATEAVFKILDDEKIKSKFGRFNDDDCERLWASGKYAEMHNELLALMSKFELCYALPDVFEPAWLAPQLLPASKPEKLSTWDAQGDLFLRYEYDFMPKGLVNRLMVRQHRYVQHTSLAWRNGVVFSSEDTEILVEIPFNGGAIIFRARGPERKDLLTILSADLDALNASFEGLLSKVYKKIPCNCETCKSLEIPHFYDFDKLKERKRLGKKTIECANYPYIDVAVQALLEGIFVDEGNQVRQLIKKGKLKEALSLLNENVDEVILIQSRFNNLQNRLLKGTISPEDDALESRQITQSILSYLDNKED